MTKRVQSILSIAILAFAIVTTPAQARSQVERWVADAAQGVMRGGEVKTTPFAPNTSYAVCFTPGQDCEGLIVREINSARKSILMQAYSFTSAPIAKALADAKHRGVDVRAILDKSQRTEKYTGATYLKNAGVPVVIDDRPAIAHNKVFVFDQQSVLTGSFNFTKSAQDRNAENLMVIKGDANLVRSYTDNWSARWRESVNF